MPYLGFSERIVLPAKDAPAKLVGLCSPSSAVRVWISHYTTSCGVGVGVRIGVVWGLIHILLRAVSKRLPQSLSVKRSGYERNLQYFDNIVKDLPCRRQGAGWALERRPLTRRYHCRWREIGREPWSGMCVSRGFPLKRDLHAPRAGALVL